MFLEPVPFIEGGPAHLFLDFFNSAGKRTTFRQKGPPTGIFRTCPGPGRQSPCRWCSGLWRSCWQRPPSRLPAAPGGTAAGRSQFEPRQSPSAPGRQKQLWNKKENCIYGVEWLIGSAQAANAAVRGLKPALTVLSNTEGGGMIH